MSYDVVALLDDLFERTGNEDGIKSSEVQARRTIGPEALPMDWRIEWENERPSWNMTAVSPASMPSRRH